MVFFQAAENGPLVISRIGTQACDVFFTGFFKPCGAFFYDGYMLCAFIRQVVAVLAHASKQSSLARPDTFTKLLDVRSAGALPSEIIGKRK
jgi:hypothetical protein